MGGLGKRLNPCRSGSCKPYFPPDFVPTGDYSHAQSGRYRAGRGRPQRRRQGGVLVRPASTAAAASGRSAASTPRPTRSRSPAEVPDFDVTPFVPGCAPQEPEDHGPGRALRRGRGRPGGAATAASTWAARTPSASAWSWAPAWCRSTCPRWRRCWPRPATSDGQLRRRPAGPAAAAGAVPAVDPEVPAEHDGGPHLADPTTPRGPTAPSRRPAPPARRRSARRSA